MLKQAMRVATVASTLLMALALAGCEEAATGAGNRAARPSFGGKTVPDQTYTVGTSITALVLPEATGGNAPLIYSLTPSVPGLQYTRTSRTLNGTPTTAGAHSMTYRVVDSDGDAATLRFGLHVRLPVPPPQTLGSVLPPLCNCQSVAWSESLSRFVAVGENEGVFSPFRGTGTAIIYSDDGETWHSASQIPSDIESFDGSFRSGSLTSVAWSKFLSRFVAVGYDSSGNSVIIYSSNGDIWSVAASSGANLTVNPHRNRGGNSLYDVVWSESLSRFVAVGHSGIIYSSDGELWVNSLQRFRLMPDDTFEYQHDFVSVNSVIWVESLSRFVAVGEGNVNVFHSPDGVNWSTYSCKCSGLHDLAWSKSLARFVAHPFYHSADGIVWSRASNSPVVYHADLAWSEPLQVFVAAIRRWNPTERSLHGEADQGLSISTDSEGNFQYPANRSGFVAYSTDGDTWNLAQLPLVPHPTGNYLRQTSYLGITWSDALSRFVVVGTGYHVVYGCSEGRNDLPCGYQYYGVYDMVLHSKDGRSWSPSLSYTCQMKTILPPHTFCRPQVRRPL